jgi:hypothetical protein
MTRSLLFAVSLILYFVVTDLLFLPLRRIPNYNLFLLLLFSLTFFIVIYRAVSSPSPAKRIIYGAFGGLILWSLIGELCPSLWAHQASLLDPISTVNIKQPSAAIYLVILLITLIISYLTEGIKDGLAMMLMVFGSTWGFELYVQNYSTRLPKEVLPNIAYTLGGIFSIVLLLAILMAAKSASPAGKTFWGYWIYFGLVYTLTCFLVLPHPMPMGF